MFSMPVSADSVGLSGECYNADGTEGGQGSVSASANGVDDDLTVDEALSIANALAHFGTESANDRSTGNACKQSEESRADYLEVHAAGNQVCYRGTVVTDGSCPTTPSGPA